MERSMEGGLHAVIMLGGPRRELWPMCRADRPKPFLDLFSEGSLLSATLKRAARLAKRDHVFVVADGRFKGELRGSGLDLSGTRLLLEPFGRGTAACIGLAAAYVKKRDPDGLIVVLPSDQLIFDEASFLDTLNRAVREARRSGAMICIGIRPKSADTLYGYIQAGAAHPTPEGASFRRVRTFAEKPELETAVRFVESGDFFWNSGILACRVEALFDACREAMPEFHRDLLDIYDAIGTHAEQRVVAEVYSCLHATSIDTAIMEKAGNVLMLEGVFGWCDPGSWDEVVAAASERAMFSGEHQEHGVVAVDAEGLFVRKPQGKVVCVLGAGELVIVDTPDALLVCGKGMSDRMGELLERLRLEGFGDRL